jgi:hypothetical protein
VIGALTLLWTAVALAKTTPAEKCDQARVTAWKAYLSCVNTVGQLGSSIVAVGTALASRPPHRSGRAALRIRLLPQVLTHRRCSG